MNIHIKILGVSNIMSVIYLKPFDWYSCDGDGTEDMYFIITGISNIPRNSENIDIKKKVVLKVRGFEPYCYIELPSNITITKGIFRNLEEAIKAAAYPYSVKSIRYVKKLPLYYYRDEKDKVPYIVVELNNISGIRRLPYKLKTFMANIDGKKIRIPLKYHEHNINSFIKYTSRYDIPISDWVEVDITPSTTVFNNGKFIQGITRKRRTKEGDMEVTNPVSLCGEFVDIEVWSHIRYIRRSPVDHGIIMPNILSFDIECYSSRYKINESAMPKATIKEDKIIQICAIFQSGDMKQKKFLICLKKNGIGCPKIEGTTVYNASSEAAVIHVFANIIKKYDIDVLIGYNIFGFDYRYINDRLRLLGKELYLGNISRLQEHRCVFKDTNWSKGKAGSVKQEYKSFSYYEVPTRMSFDLLPLVKRDYNFPEYTLKYTAKHILGEDIEGKKDLEAKELFRLWDEGTKEGIKKIGEYCIQDGVVVLQMFNRLNAWMGLCALSNVTFTPMQDIFIRGQGIKMLCQLYRIISSNERVLDYVPKRGGDIVSGEDDKYSGAIVLEPIVGKHKNVVVLDFQSMYPSIMIRYNICFTTIIPPNRDDIPDSDCHVVSWEDHVNCEHDPDIKKHKKRKKMCGRKTYRFYKHKKGLLPILLENLLEERKEVKGKMKGTTGLIFAVFFALQLALKISANSVYGTLGAPFSYVPLPQGAESVTAVGRSMIESSKEYVEENYDVKCTYGDSDSIFCVFGDTYKDHHVSEIIKLGKIIGDEITEKLFEPPIKLIYEKTFSVFLIFAKKNYTGFLIDDEGNFIGRMFKGVVSVRNDRPSFIRRLYEDVINLVLSNSSEGEIIGRIFQDLILLVTRCMPWEKLIITKKLGMSDDYKVKPAHVVLAEKMIDRGVNVTPGDRIPYLLMDIGRKCKQSEQIEDPMFYRDHKDELGIDYMYYIKNQLISSIDPVLDISYGKKLSSILLENIMAYNKVIEELKDRFRNSPKGQATKRRVTIPKKKVRKSRVIVKLIFVD